MKRWVSADHFHMPLSNMSRSNNPKFQVNHAAKLRQSHLTVAHSFGTIGTREALRKTRESAHFCNIQFQRKRVQLAILSKRESLPSKTREWLNPDGVLYRTADNSFGGFEKMNFRTQMNSIQNRPVNNRGDSTEIIASEMFQKDRLGSRHGRVRNSLSQTNPCEWFAVFRLTSVPLPSLQKPIFP